MQYIENSKLQNLNFYIITELSGMGVQFLQMGMSRMRLKVQNRQSIQPNRIERFIKIITVYEIKLINKVWQ